MKTKNRILTERYPKDMEYLEHTLKTITHLMDEVQEKINSNWPDLKNKVYDIRTELEELKEDINLN